MGSVVITGSTRGIGLGMAEEFLNRGYHVVINGRSEQSVNSCVNKLHRKYDPNLIVGKPADVSQKNQLEDLWSFAKESFGTVDIWINNAGIINDRDESWALSEDQVDAVINTNLKGSILGSQVAIKGMLEQGSGKLYNFEGFGSNGKQFQPGMGLYGTTKSAMRYFTKALVKETRSSKIVVASLSPGIVLTELLWKPYESRPVEWQKARKIFNILGDRVETVAPFLVNGAITNEKSGVVINWLTFPKVLGRFLSATFKARNIVPEQPIMIPTP